MIVIVNVFCPLCFYFNYLLVEFYFIFNSHRVESAYSRLKRFFKTSFQMEGWASFESLVKLVRA
jgi:hypothetical protein